MRILITGVSGFAGRHLAAYLATCADAQSAEVHGTVFSAAPETMHALGVIAHRVDLCDAAGVSRLVHDLAPDYVLHLAGQAFVPASWQDPWGTLEANTRTQINLLEAMRALGRGRVLVVGSNEEYGRADPARLPWNEDTPLRPDNPYGVSKVAQDLMGLSYHLSYGLDVVRVRPFNHIGPGQNERFVAAAFARQVALIEAGRMPPVLRVGNLDARRDFNDVRDVVRAYWLAATHGAPGAVYNIGSGVARPVQALLDELLAESQVSISIEEDPARLRPSDVPASCGDARALHAATGWAPAIAFEQSVRDVLGDWRGRIKELVRD